MRSFTAPLSLDEIKAEIASIEARLAKLREEAQDPSLGTAEWQAKLLQLADLRAQLVELEAMARHAAIRRAMS